MERRSAHELVDKGSVTSCSGWATSDAISQSLIVGIVVRLERASDDSRSGRDQGRSHVWSPQYRSTLIGGLVRDREAYQPLLALVVDARELPSHHDVVIVARDVPRSLCLAREGTGGKVGIKVEDAGGRAPFEVEVATGPVAPHCATDLLRHCDSTMEGPGRCLLESAGNVAAMMSVAYGVDRSVVRRERRVVVTMTVVHPLDLA